MGTDIHMVLQRNMGTSRENPEWKTIKQIELSRNYNFFGLLANVNNGEGFAGIKTGEPVPSISNDRDFPEEEGLEIYWQKDSAYIFVPNYENYYGEPMYWLGYHNHGWCTLSELKKYKHQVTECCGYVSREIYFNTPMNKRPEEWCGDASGKGVIKWDSTCNKGLPPENATYIFIKWKENTIDCIPSEINELLNELHPLKDYRLLFGFDS